MTKRFARFFTAAMFTRYGWALRIFLNLDTVVIIQLEGPSTLSNRVMPIYWCMDEPSKQLVMKTRRPIPVFPGQARRYEYERNGVSNLFMFFETLRGRRHVEVTDRRTKADWVRCMRNLSERQYPEAEVIVVVLDSLNTHTPSAFYGVFEPAEAKRLLDHFEFHYTPKHGS